MTLEATLAAHNKRLSEALHQLEQDLELAARVQHSVLPSHRLRYGNYFSDWLFLPSAGSRATSLIFLRSIPIWVLLRRCFRSRRRRGDDVPRRCAPVLHGRVVDRFLFTEAGGVQSPAEVIRILNSRFCSEENDITSYFTIIYGVIDPATGRDCCVRQGILPRNCECRQCRHRRG